MAAEQVGGEWGGNARGEVARRAAGGRRRRFPGATEPGNDHSRSPRGRGGGPSEGRGGGPPAGTGGGPPERHGGGPLADTSAEFGWVGTNWNVSAVSRTPGAILWTLTSLDYEALGVMITVELCAIDLRGPTAR